VAALPIGAYEPRWFMKPAHQDPDEAVRAFGDVRAQVFMAIHHNTFPLTDEPPEEPALRLRAASEQAKLGENRLWVPEPGEYRTVG
jgi:L-ascorbate metabolism protein UlaG (beta-lactamase superfamily)